MHKAYVMKVELCVHQLSSFRMGAGSNCGCGGAAAHAPPPSPPPPPASGPQATLPACRAAASAFDDCLIRVFFSGGRGGEGGMLDTCV